MLAAAESSLIQVKDRVSAKLSDHDDVAEGFRKIGQASLCVRLS
jgi:hypothetical protein